MTVETGALVAYGPEPDQVAEVLLPGAVNGPAPLVLLLHGGFWLAAYDRVHIRPAARALAELGCVVANVEYRRVGGGGGWPTTFADVALAADTLPGLVERAHPNRVDPDRVVYAGHSAGGQLALWAASRGSLPADAPGGRATPPAVAGVLALAPVADLAAADRLGSGSGAVAALLGGTPAQVPERFAAADPAALGIPTGRVALVHGERDESLPVTMARDYCAAVGAELFEVPGGGHHELIDPDSPAWARVTEALHWVLSEPAGR